MDQNEEISSAQMEDTGSYKQLMLRWYYNLVETHTAFDAIYLSGRGDDELLNLMISQLCEMGRQLLPKVRGGGSTLKLLEKEYQPFLDWFNNPSYAKESEDALDKIPILYNLIIRTCDLIGLLSLT